VQPVGPTTRAYTSFLLASAYGGSYGEAMGAVLPCYWIYAKVGKWLLAKGSPDPVYDRWISAYGDVAFQSVTEEMLTAIDRMGDEAPESERILVRERTRIAARYEWMFWDAGYRRESWPIDSCILNRPRLDASGEGLVAQEEFDPLAAGVESGHRDLPKAHMGSP
jgi:thiaminase/transcriptional activator TenA